MNLAALDASILWPAFAAGLLVLATHVPLGMQVLRRGIVFIDLAIAQVAGCGVLAASLFGWAPQGAAAQVAALAAALAGALFLTWTEKRWPEVQEALIGTLFVLAATGATLLLAGNPHGGEYLKDLLVGQILWVGRTQLALMAAVSAIVLIGWFGLRGRAGRAGFYGLFALSVTASVQLVGVYLVFASLIVPALAVRRARRNALLLGYVLGAAGYALGLVLSVVTDLPTGPVIAWTLAILAVALVSARGATVALRCNMKPSAPR
jgi:zinc/manganese transport system permease protein